MSKVDETGEKDSHLVSAADVQLGAPRDRKPNVPLPCPKVLLDLSDEISFQLSKFLKIKLLSSEEILTEIYCPAIYRNYFTKTEDIICFMQYICRNLASFSTRVTRCASKVKFVSNQAGKLHKPSDLYDKNEVAKLFKEDDVFPDNEFAKPEYYKTLLNLGLKRQIHITSTEVLSIAKKVSVTSDGERSQALMMLLNSRVDLLSSIENNTTLKSHLQNMKWMKTASERPQQYPKNLIFANEELKGSLSFPQQIKSLKHVYLIGSVCPTIDTQSITSLSKEFGLDSDPCINDIIKHLENTVYCYHSEQKSAVLNMLDCIYGYFNKHLTLVPSVIKMLSGQAWIWHGDGFATTDQITHDKENFNLKPYAYPLPPETSKFIDLWKTCEIVDRVDLVEILARIKHFHENNETDSEKIKHDLQISIDILNHISMTVDCNLSDPIFVSICTNETTKLTMKKLKECTFCDKEWYQLEFTSDLEDNVYLIHELIPLQTAKRLQIPSLINRTLEAEEFEYEEFGQTEPLTTRLHNILKDYNDGFAILKELIQNADDAGTTEIRFLYDERQNKNARTKLIDKGMKGFQGPALWCYNNVEFTDEDFSHIVKLGGATKEQATEKIGRFGLGFNAVYNLTDVPMFVSRQYIAIFYPHTKYLGQALCNRNRPGIRLNMQNISQ